MTIDFDSAKQRFMHFAEVVRKANSADELRALLLADTQAPYHSFDTLALHAVVETIGEELCECIGADLDEDGVTL